MPLEYQMGLTKNQSNSLQNVKERIHSGLKIPGEFTDPSPGEDFLANRRGSHSIEQVLRRINLNSTLNPFYREAMLRIQIEEVLINAENNPPKPDAGQPKEPKPNSTPISPPYDPWWHYSGQY